MCIQKILSLQYRLINIQKQQMFPFNTNPPPANWAPAPMYYPNTVNPYQEEGFLNQVFNFNQQSIAAFQTLSHELKLQFFLNVQEMKLLGYMSDKQNYQNILQEIARRKLILQKPTPVPNSTKPRKESEEWGAKLENLCQDHLKKMQRDNFLDDIPVQYNPHHHASAEQVDFLSGDNSNVKKTAEDDDDEFEWTETKETTDSVNYSSEPNVAGNIGSTQQAPAYKTFEELFVKKQVKVQLPAQKVEHIDVWDLQVIDEQPKSSKKYPQLKKADSKSKPNQSSANKQYQLKQNQPINSYRLNSASDISQFDIEYFSIKAAQPQQSSNNSINNGISNSNKTMGSNQQVYINGAITNQATLQGNQAQRQWKQQQEQIVSKNTEITNNNKQQQEFQWQEDNNVTPTLPPLEHNTNNISSNDAGNSITPTNTHNNNYIDSIGNNNNTAHSTDNTNRIAANSSYIADSQQFNYNFLESIPIVQPVQSVQIIQHNSSGLYQTQVLASNNNDNASNGFAFDTSFGLDLTGLDNQLTFNNTFTGNQPNKYEISNAYSEDLNMLHKKGGIHEEMTVPRLDDEQDQPMMASSNIMPVVDFNILQQLKVYPSTKKLSGALNKKVFDFDRQFYQEALHLIAVLGYEQNPDYDYINDQSHICDEVIRLTQLYTAAVDQDKEEEVRESLRKSKKLYLQLDTKKTATIVRKYLKMEGKSLSYQIGKLSLQAGVPKELIEKAIKSSRFNETATLLYLMVFFGNTYSISLFACQVIEYVEHLCGEMEQLLQAISNMEEQVVSRIRTNAKFIEYKDNICRIMAVARRILELGSICVRDELSPSMAKVNQQISAIIPPPAHHQLLPNYFLTFFSNFACTNCSSIYTLHSQMQEFIDEHPLCSLCLQPIEETDNAGSKKDDGKFYHFKCWNFRASVMEYKRQLMLKMESQFENTQDKEERAQS